LHYFSFHLKLSDNSQKVNVLKENLQNKIRHILMKSVMAVMLLKKLCSLSMVVSLAQKDKLIIKINNIQNKLNLKVENAGLVHQNQLTHQLKVSLKVPTLVVVLKKLNKMLNIHLK
jgi:hypothetical protein